MIRAADSHDVAAMAAIYAWYVEHSCATLALEAPTLARWREDLACGYPALVHEARGKVVGYALASRFMPRAGYDPTILTSIYLDAQHTGQGLGGPLYEELLARCGDYHLAVAGITVPNRASETLHERLGFDRVGVFREVGLKHGTRWDVAWWQRLL
ncbi:MAG: GNAT family N-acetyltransferase [Solirubrobacteraceae bacterium]